ncbi:1-(5-phosphoribosyl)-5-[(5-phosphoribosylamino) methylideneamino] imidazole-4-carboxamide isomerase [Aliiroseovarius zhejiangensis]|uniref:1-(5-phosphoribosyl)-5-[(5-phosphoribosylamino)methylideneamino] imidazole-4-carboxamide isomerase n=1 Tax=Aliiroseovarius zhejiangensis TaxID=1632025 RepID=A0ABQ3INC9_9RHOB|nr:1-(5-phosphoribosyl)-5-[(5-phosphoribosylamino)methylideneamino] imidazole-4-carboxamide isomerase [Aliiroseovarius zhejiangensis]GHE86478.1 1-(5-phosphoribosyl)-5-[(5-phosphoribosylamino) methylideneamino] imidazole-4-carboxamide isomerase [Aliiroseovarius zhejiangensis]
MIIYPTLELQNGRCVTLHRGRLEEPSIWHVDPVETAQGFAEAGAEWIHITDFDAVDGKGENAALIERIIEQAGCSVQIAGGIRTRDMVENWIEKGAGRVVLGSIAARDPDMVKELANRHPDQIVLAADVWQGQLMTDGWRNPVAITPEDFLASYADVPLASVLITDIDSDIDQPDAQLGLLSGLAGKTRHQVIAAGTVHELDDVARLKYIPNIAGTLIGRALFSKAVDLAQALAVARPEPERRAEFI